MGHESRSYRKKSPSRSSRRSSSPSHRYKSSRRSSRERKRDRSRSRGRDRSRSRGRDRSRERRRSNERKRSRSRERKRSRSRGRYRRSRSRDRRSRSRGRRSRSKDRRERSRSPNIKKTKEEIPTERISISPDVEEPVEEVEEKFDKEAEQKKLESEMKDRRERIEKWRQERKAKVLNDNKISIVKQVVIRKENSTKKWSLEEDDDDDDDDDEADADVTILTSTDSIPVSTMDLQSTEPVFKPPNHSLTQQSVEMNKDLITKDNKDTAKDNGTTSAPGGDVGSKEEDDEDEIDPLDAYMAELSNDKVLKAASKNSTSTTTGSSATKTVMKSGVKSKSKQKGELMLSNNDAMEYSSEEEGNPEFDEALAKLNKKKKDFIQVDHGRIYYKAFRKCFYIEVPEIACLTETEVESMRIDMEGIKVRGKNCPKPIKAWAQCGVNGKVMAALKRAKFITPTPIQSQAIPTIMSGRDVIGIAKTGSGKTLAFILPMLRHVLDQPQLEEGDGFIAIILTPTRELALQITKDAKKFTKSLGISITCVYGGTGVSDQIAELKAGTEIVVCTPGRMIDMLVANNGRVTNLRRCSYVVLDEADRMFDMGFEPQVMKILNNVRPDRQTVMFSATFPRQMEALARRILDKPIEIQVGGRSVVCSDVTQKVLIVEEENKFFKLLELLGVFQAKGSCIIFVDKQENADDVMKELLHHQYSCMALHGGLDQYDRDSTISDFKKGNIDLLVATSVCARGLDVKRLSLVVNYDCPNHYEDYVHRCGRTGRAGNKGHAFTFITNNQYRYAGDIIKALELSGAESCPPLQQLWDNYVAQAASEGKTVKLRSGGGFKGKGFKFDDTEAASISEKKKAQMASLGFDNEDEDVDISSAALPSSSTGIQEINGQNIDQHIENMFSSVRKVHEVAPSVNSGNIAGNSSASAPISAAGTKKLEMAKRLAAKLNVSTTPAATSLHDPNDINQATAAAVFSNSALPRAAFTSSSAGSQSKSIAEQMALKIHAKLGYNKPEEGAQDNDDEEKSSAVSLDPSAMKRYEEELEINDFPQTARWKVTSKEALAQISEFSEAGITVRGVFVMPNKEPKDGERRLYLAIEAINELAISKAKAEISRLIKDELIRLATTYQPVNKARYKVV